MKHEGENPSLPVSDLARFLGSLGEHGRAAVSAASSETPDEDAAPLLEELDARARSESALELPAYSATAALWGARLFHQLCRFVVCRELGEAQINAACAVPAPGRRGPETDWSVDLTLRHLPRVFQLARHLSNADPLVGQLQQLAAAWPLSSVGIPGLEKLQMDSVAGHPGLRRLYADRIIAAGDDSRLGDAQVDDLLRADLGVHRDLAPLMAGKLFSIPNDTH